MSEAVSDLVARVEKRVANHKIDGDCPCHMCDMARLLAEVKALQAERQPCGHEAHYLMKSAETSEPLFCEICDLRKQRDDAATMEQWFRDRVGECHLMISRNVAEFQSGQEYENTSLPYRVRAMIRDKLAAEAELTQLREQAQAAKKDAESWKSHWQMYRDAWVRELGGWLLPKHHEIDALVLTTRVRCVNPILGNCSVAHWLGAPTEDRKALTQTAHPEERSCRNWRAALPAPPAEREEK